MSFGDFLSDLDATAFAELADDTAAIWQRGNDDVVTLAVMMGAGERVTSTGGIALVQSGQVARMSVAEINAKVPESAVTHPYLPRHPAAGDKLTVNGVLYIVHGEPWLDEAQGGRDWLCPITL